jgi:hypothetical protein
MRDLRIIVIESNLLEAGCSPTGIRHALKYQLPATRREKALSKRASLLAASLGRASCPTFVAGVRAYLEAHESLGGEV